MELSTLQKRVLNYLALPSGSAERRRALADLIQNGHLSYALNDSAFIERMRAYVKASSFCDGGKKRFLDEFPEFVDKPKTRKVKVELEFEVEDVRWAQSGHSLGEALLRLFDKDSDSKRNMSSKFTVRCFPDDWAVVSDPMSEKQQKALFKQVKVTDGDRGEFVIVNNKDERRSRGW